MSDRFANAIHEAGRLALLSAGFAVFLSVTDVYGVTGAFGVPAALLYWFVLIVAGNLVGEGASILSKRAGLGTVWTLLLAAAASTLAVSAMLAALNVMLGTALTAQGLGLLFAYVLVITIAVMSVSHLLSERRAGAAESGGLSENSERGADADAAAIWRRFARTLPPPHRHSAPIAIQSEDHYLRIHTQAGSTLVLGRLSDAAARLEGSGAVRVHRSWIVFGEAVSGSAREKGRLLLELDGLPDVRVPVSRTYLEAAREAGLAAR